MTKWLLVIVAGAVLLGMMGPTFARLRIGRLPGDLRFCYRGRQIYLPIATTLLISFALTVLARII